ncbi:Major facilitator superfamily [Macrophomina phaseolina MS6]|uniref:Major facilitator superfamily n=1 Tax=Macrophomina phaseolina (strain MS6) TaxID=1126212 RepID=K2RXF4_MACPH|nr:Major facilitator superfamily [Macrophomina phaseolina MS6]
MYLPTIIEPQFLTVQHIHSSIPTDQAQIPSQTKIAEREQLAKHREEHKAEKLILKQIQLEKTAQLAAERETRRKRGGENLGKPPVKRRKITIQVRAEAPEKATQKQKQASKNRLTATDSSAEVRGSGRNGSNQDGQVLGVSRTGRKIAPPRRYLD